MHTVFVVDDDEMLNAAENPFIHLVTVALLHISNYRRRERLLCVSDLLGPPT